MGLAALGVDYFATLDPIVLLHVTLCTLASLGTVYSKVV